MEYFWKYIYKLFRGFSYSQFYLNALDKKNKSNFWKSLAVSIASKFSSYVPNKPSKM